MTFPRTEQPEYDPAQSSPWLPINRAGRVFDAFCFYTSVVDRNLATPPGTCDDGARYLVAAAANGDWTGRENHVAIAVGTNASNGWYFVDAAVEGTLIYLADEDFAVRWDGSDFLQLDTGSAYTDTDAREAIHSVPTTITGTSHVAVIGNAYGYLRFTDNTGVTFEIPPESSVPWPAGCIIAFEQAGDGTVTLDPGSGVTINSRDGALDTAGKFAVGQIKYVGADVWTAIGDLA